MSFYLQTTQFKYKIRSGWNKTHWNVSKEMLVCNERGENSIDEKKLYHDQENFVRLLDYLRAVDTQKEF